MILHEITSGRAGGLDPGSTVVVVSLGAVEQHSVHLPLGTDSLVAAEVAAGVEQRMPENVVLVPPLWFGASDHHLGRPGTVSIGSRALVLVASEVIASLHASSGWRRVLVVNGHGGNQPAVRMVVERLRRSCPDVLVWGFDYWDAAFDVLDERGVAHPGGMGHADVLETSAVAARWPHLLGEEREPDGYTDGLPGWLHTSRGIVERTVHGGVGDPTHASAGFGAAFLDAAVEGAARLASRLLQEP